MFLGYLWTPLQHAASREAHCFQIGNNPVMDLVRSMAIFVRVAQRGSFSAAARDLGLSTAAVTKHVASLERRAAVRLLHRTTRRVELTEGGRIYVERCQECLQAVSDADAALSTVTKELVGTLCVTTPVEFSPHLMPVVMAYLRDHAKMRIDLRLSNRTLDLLEHGIDLAIDVLGPVHASCVARPLAASRLALWGSPAYLNAHGRPRSPADLGRHRHLVFTEPRPRTDLVMHKGRTTRHVQLIPTLLSSSGDALRQAVIAGGGLHMAPTFVMAADCAAGRVERVLPDWRLDSLELYVIYPSRRFVAAKVRVFLELLRDRFGSDVEHDAWEI